MSHPLDFRLAGRIPEPGDNVAIAIRRLDAGTWIQDGAMRYVLPHTILEGHRFARAPIKEGEALLSWGLPFGHARRAISSGEYICNEKILEALKRRRVEFSLPEIANFRDHFCPPEFDEQLYAIGAQVPLSQDGRTFEGFARAGGRGYGTRNHIVVIGLTSHEAALVTRVARQLDASVRERYANIDGVVAIAHTEGGGPKEPNNKAYLLRTLAGYLVHPNVGACVVVDLGESPVSHQDVFDTLSELWPETAPAEVTVIQGGNGFQDGYARAVRAVEALADVCQQTPRTPCPVSGLKIALQCGGSDAFSGISGNPLAGWIAKEVIRRGGCANLAETDELIGAERYALRNVRSEEVARDFLRHVRAFEHWTSLHGHSGASNPSGGNNFRGLYNIAIKSIGAARKRDPEVRLDYVIDYSEPMPDRGFYFMNSPGNDLESVAGQVASGANLIVFVTGNGSITNFPFVPTIKVVTTSERYRLLSEEMDVNAGRYQDGESMASLGMEAFELAISVASGGTTAGERAGHSQVQIWREWRQSDDGSPEVSNPEKVPPLVSDPFRPSLIRPLLKLDEMDTNAALQSSLSPFLSQLKTMPERWSRGLVLPTSLCAGQVARLIVSGLENQEEKVVSQWSALVHTEGCGSSDAELERMQLRTLSGYLRHPFTQCASLLEHGCEKTHNDAFRIYLDECGMDVDSFGWASIQMDGGIKNVTSKLHGWSRNIVASRGGDDDRQVAIGIYFDREVPAEQVERMGRLVALLEASGVAMVCAGGAGFSSSQSLAYGEPVSGSGVYQMETPTDHRLEILSGLGGTGVFMILDVASRGHGQGLECIPVLQINGGRAISAEGAVSGYDIDVEGAVDDDYCQQLLRMMSKVALAQYRPLSMRVRNLGFQLTRGLHGVSL